MILSHHQQHQLQRIETGLLGSDPQLTAMLGIFGKLSAANPGHISPTDFGHVGQLITPGTHSRQDGPRHRRGPAPLGAALKPDHQAGKSAHRASAASKAGGS